MTGYISAVCLCVLREKSTSRNAFIPIQDESLQAVVAFKMWNGILVQFMTKNSDQSCRWLLHSIAFASGCFSHCISRDLNIENVVYALRLYAIFKMQFVLTCMPYVTHSVHSRYALCRVCAWQIMAQLDESRKLMWRAAQSNCQAGQQICWCSRSFDLMIYYQTSMHVKWAV